MQHYAPRFLAQWSVGGQQLFTTVSEFVIIVNCFYRYQRTMVCCCVKTLIFNDGRSKPCRKLCCSQVLHSSVTTRKTIVEAANKKTPLNLLKKLATQQQEPVTDQQKPGLKSVVGSAPRRASLCSIKTVPDVAVINVNVTF